MQGKAMLNSSLSLTSSVNPVRKYESKPNQSESKLDFKSQICTRKGHSTLNCYNRINLTKFPPMHSRVLSPSGLNGSNTGSQKSVNMIIETEEPSVWYPDSSATSHIRTSSEYIQRPRAFIESAGQGFHYT